MKIENPADREEKIRCDALVDTGASHMILASAWRDRLGDFEVVRRVKLEPGTQASVDGAVCGPVHIQIEGSDPVFSKVIFGTCNRKTATSNPWSATSGWSRAQRPSTCLGTDSFTSSDWTSNEPRAATAYAPTMSRRAADAASPGKQELPGKAAGPARPPAETQKGQTQAQRAGESGMAFPDFVPPIYAGLVGLHKIGKSVQLGYAYPPEVTHETASGS